MNRRRHGYEPCELSNCSIPRYFMVFNVIPVPDTGFEPATSWSQTMRSSQAEPIRYMRQIHCRNIAGDEPARKANVVIIRCDLIGQTTPPGLEPGLSAVTGLRNNQLSYRAIFGLLLKYAPQLHIRALFAPRSKPSWQGENRTHDVSLWLIYSQLPSPLGLPASVILTSFLIC